MKLGKTICPICNEAIEVEVREGEKREIVRCPKCLQRILIYIKNVRFEEG